MDLSVDYLGLKLKNPIIIASSPFTMTVDKIKRLEESGAAAVVLKSVFEEQIKGEAAFLEAFNNYPEAADYLNSYVEQDNIRENLQLIRDLKEAVGIPVIASINCTSDGAWADYAKKMEEAGADAIELNIFILPTDTEQKCNDIEEQYLGIVHGVTSRVGIPVSVKLTNHFTNVLGMCRQLYFRGAKGVVMFNRMFEPDIDIENMTMVSADSMSSHTELRNSLRAVGMCSPQLPMLDIAVTTGVHTGEDVVKSLLAGAKAVEICSALYLQGLHVIEQMLEFTTGWMERHNFAAVSEFTGIMSDRPEADKEMYQRVQYMKFFPHGGR